MTDSQKQYLEEAIAILDGKLLETRRDFADYLARLVRNFDFPKQGGEEHTQSVRDEYQRNIAELEDRLQMRQAELARLTSES